jgi:hypothetical protein
MLSQEVPTLEKYRKKNQEAFALRKGEAALGPTFEKYRKKSRGIFVCRAFLKQPQEWLYSSATNYNDLESILPIETLSQPLITI